MKYTYKARTPSGAVETGTVEASSREAAIQLLMRYKVFVTSLVEQEGGGFLLANYRFERKVSSRELVIFFRQLSVMLESRVPVVQSLNILAEQTKKQGFKKAINKVASLVQEGAPLSEALGQFPKIFGNFYVNLVKSGETSGNISGSLSYIASNLEMEDDITSQVKQAMIYPMFVLSVLVVVIGIVVVVVMPRIADLIKNASTQPPFFTVLMLGVYAFIAQYWWVLLAFVVFLVSAGILYAKTKEGWAQLNRLALKTPFISTFLKKVFLTRFCGNISTLLGSGISINRALDITKDAINSAMYGQVIEVVGKSVSEGEKMSTAMAEYPDYFPTFVVQMIKVGEETGRLDKTLLEVVSFYQKDVKRSIDLFSSLLEPIMIIFLGGVVAMLAISVIEPLFSSLSSIS